MNDTGMKAFLGRVVTEVLGWRDVEQVVVRLENSFRFEDNGVDGVVNLLLVGNRRCGCMFSSYELKLYRGDPMDLLDRLKRVMEGAMTRGEMADDTPLNDVVSRLSSE